MAQRDQQTLIDEINKDFTQKVSPDAKFTIMTIRNLIESNTRVEASIDELHHSLSKANVENEKLQKRIYFLTVVTVVLTLIQAAGVIIELLKKF